MAVVVSGVDEGCEDTLTWWVWPWPEAGVFTAGDLWAKGRLVVVAVPGRGEAISRFGVER